jgi:hypothetical protein
VADIYEMERKLKGWESVSLGTFEIEVDDREDGTHWLRSKVRGEWSDWSQVRKERIQ